MVNEWQFFDISFHYFHSNQEIWHAAETFGSKHPNGFRKCMIGHFLHRPSELVVSSPTMTWKQNLPHELDWATVRAFTSTLRCTKNRFPYDFQTEKKDNKSCSLAKQKKNLISWWWPNRGTLILHPWFHQSSLLTVHFAPVHMVVCGNIWGKRFWEKKKWKQGIIQCRVVQNHTDTNMPVFINHNNNSGGQSG